MPGEGRKNPLSPLELQNQRANKMLAERHGYGARTVARELGVSHQAVDHWYHGRRKPAGEVAERYAAFLARLLEADGAGDRA